MLFKVLIKILKSNTGYSSKTLTMLWAMAIGTIMFLIILFILLIDLFTDYSIKTDLYGIATVIGAISAFIVSTIAGKVYGDKQYIKRNNEEEDDESELNNIKKL